MTISELFKTAVMPKVQIVTFNDGYTSNKEFIPAKAGWNRRGNPISSPHALIQNGWVSSDKGQSPISVLAPARFNEISRKASDPEVFWLGLDFDSPQSISMNDLLPQLQNFCGVWYTTKSHQINKGGVQCDRWRCFLVYSRPVSDIENRRIHILLSNEIGHDRACGDGGRVFRPSLPSCKSGYIAGKFAVDVDNLIRLCDKWGIEDNSRKKHGIIEGALDENGVDWSRGKVNPALAKSLNPDYSRKLTCT